MKGPRHRRGILIVVLILLFAIAFAAGGFLAVKAVVSSREARSGGR